MKELSFLILWELGKRRAKSFACAKSESLEENMGDEVVETTSPVAPRSFAMEDTNESGENELSGDIVDEQRNPLLELKKCKEWLQQQKINHEAELLARKLLSSDA